MTIILPVRREGGKKNKSRNNTYRLSVLPAIFQLTSTFQYRFFKAYFSTYPGYLLPRKRQIAAFSLA
jgi:hypothetical protein